MTTTIKDVAREAGCSPTTVSLVLNKQENRISEETKVIKAAEKLNYTRNELARNLVRKKSNLIAMIVPDLINPYYTEISNHIINGFAKLGYTVMVLSTNNDVRIEDSGLEILNNGFFEGGIAVSIDFENFKNKLNPKVYEKLVVLEEVQDIMEDIHVVTTDNYKGGRLAAKYLSDMGHKRLICCTSLDKVPNHEKRLEGFGSYLHEIGVEFDDYNSILRSNLEIDGIEMFAEYVISEDVTGVFCVNDLIALGLISGLRKRGKRVPEDVSIIGYDNAYLNRFYSSDLTSVDSQIKRISRGAINILTSLLDEEKCEKINLVPPILHEGETVKRIDE